MGMCSVLCDPAEPDGCPDDGLCLAFAGTDERGFCEPRCTTHGDCARDSYLCVQTRVEGVTCSSWCGDDDECGPGASCDVEAGRCRPPGPVTPRGARLGEACTQASDCWSSLCITSDLADGYVQGYCTRPCSVLQAGLHQSNCGEGVACNSSGYCAAACTRHDDCRAGYLCVSTSAGEPNGCLPGCTDERPCPDGFRCVDARCEVAS